MSVDSIVTLYNPGEKSKSKLLEEFVVRIDSFNKIFNGIKDPNTDTKKRHYLIVGQRGAGKTTLLHRLKYAIEDDPTLSNLIPINLGEEQYHVNSVSDLWECISEILDDYYGFKGLSTSAKEGDPIDEVTSIRNICNALIDKRQRVILFIDNFGDLLKKFGEDEIERLKLTLTTRSEFQVIAGTPVALESVLVSTTPIFQFLNLIELKGLDNSETKALLLKLAMIHGVTDRIEKIINDKPERIEILRRLTGGVIRTMVLLFKIFTETGDGSSIQDLQLVLDSLTPLYKHRMDDLPAQQQKIIDVVARNWDAISVKDITRKTNIVSKAISAQLRQLEKNEIIAKVSTDSKNHLYQLQERFFNIWYLMRYGRKYDRKRVIWLVRFFETWCDKNELEQRIQLHIEDLRKEKYDANSAVLMGEAYVGCNIAREIKEKLIETTSNLYPKDFDKNKFDLDDDIIHDAQLFLTQGNIEEAIKKLDSVQKLTEKNYRAVVSVAFDARDYERAINILKKAEDQNLLTAPDFQVIGAVYEKEMEEYEEALKYYRKASELGLQNAEVDLACLLYEHLDRVEEAEEIFLSLLKGDPENASYYHELGHIYGYHKKDYNRAIESFLKSIELGRASANYCLGALYQYELKNLDKAKYYYSFDENANFNIARLYRDLEENYSEALDYFQKAIKDDCLAAYFQIGKLYELHLKDDLLAIRYYDLAFKKADDYRALRRMANLYEKNETTHGLAEKYFKLAIEKGDPYAAVDFAAFYYFNGRELEAVEYINQGKKLHPDQPYVFEMSASIMLWLDKFEESIEDLKVVLSDGDYVEANLKDITSLIIKLLSKKQYHPVLELFTNPKFNLTDIMKPVYFALMTLLKHQFPNESLKMGVEISETVNEILNEIKNLEMKIN